MTRRSLSFVPALLFVLGLSHAALADSVSFTLGNPVQSIAGGGTLSYTATVTAAATNTGLEYLNALSYSIAPANSFTFDKDPFLNNYPFSLSAGQSYTGVLFNLVIPTGATFTTYLGSVSLLGGITDGSLNTLGTQAFTTSVVGAAATPEPESWALLATGLLGGAFLLRRSRAGVLAERSA